MMPSKFDRMVQGAQPKVNIDPQHKEIHRVRLKDMEKYKAGVVKNVTAICGKTWAPTVPFTGNLRERENCSLCFPGSEYRLVLAT